MMVLFLSLVAVTVIVPVLAYPPQYGLITANNNKHIVRNYLYDNNGLVSAWITFACQSVEGFQYSVTVRGLSPGTTYSVRAESLTSVFVPEIGWLPTSDGAGNTYSLGTITVNGEGKGEVSGLIPLPATHPFLPLGLRLGDKSR